jgi:predicted nuclease of predicted toxin-antitoxin system
VRFLVDQSAPARLVEFLHSQGHDATRVGAEYPHGLADVDVLAIAAQEGRILLTSDRDFGELIFVRAQPHSGVIYFRLTTTTLAGHIARLTHVLAHYSDDLDAFLVVTD